MKLRLIIMGVLVVVVGGLLAAVVLWPRPKTPPVATALPSPNGYDDLRKAGAILSGELPANAGAAELKAYVTLNAAAIELARTGLSRECLIPLEYSMGFISNHFTDLGTHKRLARTLVAQGQLAESERRTNEAAQAFLDVIKLGSAACRGGFMIDSLVGVACETLGTSAMSSVLPGLDTATAREVVKVLTQLEATQEPTSAVYAREETLKEKTYGWQGALVSAVTAKTDAQAKQKYEQKVESRDRQRRHLLMDAAARAFELETGARPKTIRDLVPKYLATVPKDPRTGGELEHAFAP